MKIKKNLLATAALVCTTLIFQYDDVSADGWSDYYTQQAARRYFNTTTTARNLGMAGSSTQTSSDSSNIVGNPAGLGMMQGGEFSTSYGHNQFSGREFPGYASIEQDEEMLQGLLTLPIVPTIDGTPNYGNIGIGWSGYDSDSDDLLNTRSRGNEIHGAYSKAINDSFSVGYAINFFDDELKGDNFSYDSSNNFRHALGAHYQVSEQLTVGSTFAFGHGNYDVSYQGNKDSSSLRQYSLDAGVAYRLDSTLLTAAAGYGYYDTEGTDLVLPSDVVVGGDEDGHSIMFSVGIEQSLTDWLALRAGYRYNGFNDYSFKRADLTEISGSSKYNAFAMGVGVAIPVGNHYVESVHVDYGAEYRSIGDGDWQHLVTVSVPFDLCKPL